MFEFYPWLIFTPLQYLNYLLSKYSNIKNCFNVFKMFKIIFFRNDSDTDYDELSDGEINKLLIVTQTPVRPRKHEGFDRSGDHLSR